MSHTLWWWSDSQPVATRTRTHGRQPACQPARAGQTIQGKAAAQMALFSLRSCAVRSPTRIDDDSPAEWMALGAYAELLLSAQEGRRARRSATAHAEGVLLMAICEAVPGSSRGDEPSIAFNNGGCLARGAVVTWQHAVCVLPLVEGRAKRGGAALYTLHFTHFRPRTPSSDSTRQPRILLIRKWSHLRVHISPLPPGFG